MYRDLDGTRLFVGDLASFCDESHIQDIFENHGFEIANVKLMRGKQSLSSLSYGFAQLRSREDAVKAIALLDGKLVYGRNIKVRWASQGSGKKNPNSVNSIYVKFQALENNIDVTEETLRHVFSTFGVVTDASVKASNMTRHASECDCGYGFVHFQEGEDGIAAAFRAIGGLTSSPVVDNVEFVCEPSQNLLRNVHQLKKERKHDQGRPYESVLLPSNVSRSPDRASVSNSSNTDAQDLDNRFGTKSIYRSDNIDAVSQGNFSSGNCHPSGSSQLQNKQLTRNSQTASTHSNMHHRSPISSHFRYTRLDERSAQQVNTKQPNMLIYNGPPGLVLPSSESPPYLDLSSTDAPVNIHRHTGSRSSSSYSDNYSYAQNDVFTPSLGPDPMHISPPSVSRINSMMHPYESSTSPHANSWHNMGSHYEDKRRVFAVPRAQFIDHTQVPNMYGNPGLNPIKSSYLGVPPLHPYSDNTLYIRPSSTGNSFGRHGGQDIGNEPNTHVPTSSIEYSMENLALRPIYSRYASNNSIPDYKLGFQAPLKDSNSYTTDGLTATGESENSCSIYRGCNNSRGSQVSNTSGGLEVYTTPNYHNNPPSNSNSLNVSQHLKKLSSKSDPSIGVESVQFDILSTYMDHIKESESHDN